MEIIESIVGAICLVTLLLRIVAYNTDIEAVMFLVSCILLTILSFILVFTGTISEFILSLFSMLIFWIWFFKPYSR